MQDGPAPSVGDRLGDAAFFAVRGPADASPRNLEARHPNPPLTHDPSAVRESCKGHLAPGLSNFTRPEQIDVPELEPIQLGGLRVQPEDTHDFGNPAFGNRLEHQADPAIAPVTHAETVRVQERVGEERPGVGGIVDGRRVSLRLDEAFGGELVDGRGHECGFVVRRDCRRIREYENSVPVQRPLETLQRVGVKRSLAGPRLGRERFPHLFPDARRHLAFLRPHLAPPPGLHVESGQEDRFNRDIDCRERPHRNRP